MARPYLQGSLSRILIAGLFLVVGIVGCGEGGPGKHHDGGGGGTTAFGVKQLGTTADDIGWGVATDKDGNVFVTGETQGNLFDTNAGGRDIFLIKYNSDGSRAWGRQLGTTADDIGWGVATDKDGNVFVTGETQGNLFDTNAGGRDIFLIKYNSDGSRAWGRQLGTTADDIGWGVATDKDGNVFVTGETQGNLFDTNAGGRDIFLIKYNSDGSRAWGRQLGTTADDIGHSVTTNAAGNIFVTGETQGNLFDTNAGLRDIFLIKYNSDGSRAWGRQLGTTADDIGHSVTTNAAGNIFVTGETQGNLFDTNAGLRDIFLIKYNSDGSRAWGRQLGTTADDIGHSVTTNAAGNIFVTGETQGNLFDTNAGLRDIFLIKYDTSGSIIWATQLGTTAADIGHSVATNAAGNIFVTGETQGNLGGNTNAGLRDIFLMKFSSAGVLR